MYHSADCKNTMALHGHSCVLKDIPACIVVSEVFRTMKAAFLHFKFPKSTSHIDPQRLGSI